MATNVPAFLTALQNEANSVKAALTAIDRADEKRLYDEATAAREARWAQAAAAFQPAQDRWDLVLDKEARLAALNRQIVMLGGQPIPLT